MVRLGFLPMQYHLPLHGSSRRRGLAAASLLVWIGALFCFPWPGAAQETERALTDFTATVGRWQRREWTAQGQPQSTPLEPAAATQGGGRWLRLPLSLPGRNEFVAPVEGSWQGWQTLTFRVFLPAGLPANAVVCVFTKDRDHLWRQIRRPAPTERAALVEITVPVGGPAAASAWSPREHERPWHPLTPRCLIEYGLSLELETGATDRFQGDAFLAAVVLRQPGLVHPADSIRDLNLTPHSPRVGERFEVSFRLGDDYRDPFHPDSVKVEAAVTTPSGTVDKVRGFYDEDFLYDPRIADITRTLTPYGAPSFKTRYCPRATGRHRIEITATVEGRVLTLPPMEFVADAPTVAYRGSVRRDPANPKYLMWEDGTHFWSLGLNVRSPFDTRYLQVAPYSTWRDEGLPLYDRLFKTYRENGIRVVEVWMSSWWMALEWINDSPGFHGVGYYNPYRAWMLDHIMEQAAANDILVILVLNNHGKFGALNDTEWSRNPYNRANGGFLDSCEEYFTNEAARAAFRRTCDYIVARWGASPNLLMWKLFSEVDLTGTSYEFYTQPEVAEWHREMGAYLKRIDPWQHLTTTHWMLSYYRINDAIALLPELDVLTTDAYYQGGGTAQLLEMLRGGNLFAAAKQKPLLITEYGGSPHADSMGNLIRQAHLGIWTGFFNEAPASPMFWWFALVEDKNLYPLYAALSRYSADEDRRGLAPGLRDLPGRGLTVSELRGDDRLLVWGFDSAYYLSDDENAVPAVHAEVVYETPALKPGDYTVEIWNVTDGRPTDSVPLTIAAGQAALSLRLPPFSRDFALKINPAAP